MIRPGRRLRPVALALLCTAGLAAADLEVRPPIEEDSVRFAVIGDGGTGGDNQEEVAGTMTRSRAVFPFEFVLMLGDNLYGSEDPDDYVEKFEAPYKALLDAGVRFYASLGNHDDPNQRFYEPFNMGGERYYAFAKGPVRFFALDSNYMDRDQLAWLERELGATTEPWKMAFFHHPPYSSGGRHGSEEDLREQLEPLFIRHGVQVVFSGHEHFYERVKPQRGVQYFISGAAGRLRRGDIRRTDLTAVGFDEDRSFMLVEVADERMHFQAISREGRLVDRGVVSRRPNPGTARLPCSHAPHAPPCPA